MISFKLDNIGKEMKKIRESGCIFVVSDSNVAPIYLERAILSLESEGFETGAFVLPAGEDSKSGRVYIQLLEAMAENYVTRSDCLVVLGGGVVGDLGGFAAATYLRGIPYVQIPTTLLAAVDSSVGGKTAINLSAGKNLAGAFHQPQEVFLDTELMKTLPDVEFRDGMAEIIKYGMIADNSLLETLRNRDEIFSSIEEIVTRCIEIKRGFVNEDEFDYGVRKMLNFGHTIGHAIEKCSDFKVSHGQAVAKGMYRMTRIAEDCEICSTDCRKELEDILNLYEFDLEIGYPDRKLCEAIRLDKKCRNNSIDIVVPEAVGKGRLLHTSVDKLCRIMSEDRKCL